MCTKNIGLFAFCRLLWRWQKYNLSSSLCTENSRMHEKLWPPVCLISSDTHVNPAYGNTNNILTGWHYASFCLGVFVLIMWPPADLVRGESAASCWWCFKPRKTDFVAARWKPCVFKAMWIHAHKWFMLIKLLQIHWAFCFQSGHVSQSQNGKEMKFFLGGCKWLIFYTLKIIHR